jgi:hypothetical protein
MKKVKRRVSRDKEGSAQPCGSAVADGDREHAGEKQLVSIDGVLQELLPAGTMGREITG